METLDVGQGFGQDFKGDAGKHGDTIPPARLTHRMGLVAKAREFHRRDLFRRAAGFLQKHQIRLLAF